MRIAFEFIAWFSGCGASSWGLVKAGGRGLLALDYSRQARNSHRRNLPNIPAIVANLADATVEEVRGIMQRYGVKDPKNWRGVHVVTAPCQGASQAGQMDPEDVRNRLMLLAATLAEACPHAWILFENVTGITVNDGWDGRPKNRKILGQLLRRINKARKLSLKIADLKRYVLSALDCGLPQPRRRIVLPIPPKGVAMPEPVRPRLPHTTIGQFVGPRSGFRDPYPKRFAELTKEERKLYGPMRPSENLGQSAKRMGRKCPEAIRELASTPWGKKLRRTSWDSNNATVCSVLRDRSLGRIDMIHPTKLRHYTVWELMALQGMPLHWRIRGSLYQQYEQIGNAFPPIMAEIAARAYVLGEYPSLLP